MFARRAVRLHVWYIYAMQISDEAIDEFIRIYKKEFKNQLDRKEASEIASRVIVLYQLLAKKLPNEQETSGVTPPGTDDPPRKIGFQM
jgi:hypothetical protein